MSYSWETHWKDYYQILQVHPTAEQEVIKATYDRLARKYHPDVNQEPSSAQRMAEINEAYEVLGTLETRRLYHPVWLQRRREPTNRQTPPKSSTNRETGTRQCPFCTETIAVEAIKCRYCGEWVDGRSVSSRLVRFSAAQPIWHYILLSVITFSLYDLYWFYRTMRLLRDHETWDISPGWRLVGLFVPILNLFILYDLFKNIRDFADAENCKGLFSPGWMLVVWIFFNLLYNLPEPYWLISFLSVLPIGVIQGTLNNYWSKKQPKLIMRTKLSAGQIVLLILGGIVWYLFIVGTTTPDLYTPVSW